MQRCGMLVPGALSAAAPGVTIAGLPRVVCPIVRSPPTVKNKTETEETDESWTKVCRRQTNMKSSLHKSKWKGNGG